jgi:hypothetical protein
VICHFAAALGLEQFYVSGGQLRRARQDMAGVGVTAEGQDRLVLEEDQLVADGARASGRNEAVLQVPGVAIARPAEPPGRYRRGGGVGPIR